MKHNKDFIESLRRLYEQGKIVKMVLDDLLQKKKIDGDEYLYITARKES